VARLIRLALVLLSGWIVNGALKAIEAAPPLNPPVGPVPARVLAAVASATFLLLFMGAAALSVAAVIDAIVAAAQTKQ
jgi:hypothetical protein